MWKCLRFHSAYKLASLACSSSQVMAEDRGAWITEDFTTQAQWASWAWCSHGFPLLPSPMGQCGGGPGRGCTLGGSIMSQPRNLKLRKPRAFQGAAGIPVQPLPHKQTLSLFFWSGNRSASALEGDSIPQGCLLYKHLWKDTWEPLISLAQFGNVEHHGELSSRYWEDIVLAHLHLSVNKKQ